ncbi:MAG: helix-turn-helix domain-containing protein [Prevotellaceae bacterium]|nr:helix-turn-helix domain-containing protein [Prevotellaceae bacterium]
MKDRIYKIMKESGMNQKEFSSATGIATATLSNIFNGRTSATLNHAKAIHTRFPDLRMEWLLFGEGDMHIRKTEPSSHLWAPTLFDERPVQDTTPSVAEAPVQSIPQPDINRELLVETVKEAVRQIERPRRNVVEIRVFFDDGTYDVFQANRQSNG